MVANKANIVTIIQRNTNTSGVDHSLAMLNYSMSLPINISKNNINCDSVYMFLFSEPRLLNEYHKLDISNDSESSADDDIPIEPYNDIESVTWNINEETFISRKKTKFEPENVQTLNSAESKSNHEAIDNGIQANDRYIENNNEAMKEGIGEDNFSMCKICWLFKKAICSECTYKPKFNNKIVISEIRKGYSDRTQANKVCNYCWIFKQLDKCDICKKSNTVNDMVNVETPNTENVQDTVSNNLCEISKHLMNTWHCNICLTTNGTDVETCCCCESQIALNDPIKLNLKPSTEYFDNNSSVIQDKLEEVTCNKISDIAMKPDINPESNKTNIINNGFQINDSPDLQIQNNIINMEVEIISENVLNSTMEFQLSNGLPPSLFTVPCDEQMEIDENVQINSIKPFDSAMNYERNLNTIQPLQFHIGIGFRDKSKINKQVKNIHWNRK